jgi:cytochrome c-type biogenesis protein CcmH/NrfF
LADGDQDLAGTMWHIVYRIQSHGVSESQVEEYFTHPWFILVAEWEPARKFNSIEPLAKFSQPSDLCGGDSQL